MTVAGIDFSTKAIDIVLLDDDTDAAVWHRIPLEHEKGSLELARSVRALPTRSWWEEHGVWLVGIEDPMSRFPHVAKKLGIVAGALMAMLPRDLAVIPTQPGEWQKLFLDVAKLPTKSDERKTLIRGRVLSDDGAGNCRGCGSGLDSIEPGCPYCRLALDAIEWPQDAFDAYGIAWSVRKLNHDAIARNAA